MNKEHIQISSNDGKTGLHVIVWTPDGEPKAVVQLVHGMCEYIDRYHDFAVYLNENGFAVIGHDHLGHGQSVTNESRLGYFADKDGDKIVIDDMHAVTLEAKKRWPGRKVFILGHSMGSFMVRRYITKYSADVDGTVIMGTGQNPAALTGVGKTLSQITAGIRGPYHKSGLLNSLTLGNNNKPFEPSRTPFDWLSCNEENVDRYIADPLCGFPFTAQAYKDFFTVMNDLARHKDYDKIRKDLPVLITSGALDPVGGEKACPLVEAELKDTGLADVTLLLYPGDRHEILNENDREKVFADLKNWFESKI